MKISKLYWDLKSKGGVASKNEAFLDVRDNPAGNRATGKTTAYCLKLISEVMSRPETRIEILDEPFTSYSCFDKYRIAQTIQELTSKMGLDWFKVIRTQGKFYMVYEPYCSITQAWVLDE